ncbi:MAG: flagellar motor protein MotB [Clostridium sp.]
MKKKEHHDEHVDETWLIPYADMLTLLLALFIVMFAMSKVDAEKFKKVSAGMNNAFMGGSSALGEGDAEAPIDEVILTNGQIEEQAMNDIKLQVENSLNNDGYSDKVEVSINDDGLQINIKDVILFDSAKADIKNNSNNLLIDIAHAIKGLDNDIKVIGHSDNRPINNSEFVSNWDLSAMRAINIMQFMTSSGGLAPENVSIEAYGEYKPKYDNSTEEGRAGNRRVEVSIIRKYPVDNSEEKSNQN